MFTVQKVVAKYVNCTFIREKANNGGKNNNLMQRIKYLKKELLWSSLIIRFFT
jgi:hypothetical protein